MDDDDYEPMEYADTMLMVTAIGSCQDDKEVFRYLKSLDRKLNSYRPYYAFKSVPIDIKYDWYIDSYDKDRFELEVQRSCTSAGVDSWKLLRADGKLMVIYPELYGTLEQGGLPYLRLDEDGIQFELAYPDESKPIDDVVSMIIQSCSRDKINGDSMMKLIRLGLPLDRAEVLHPGMVAKYKLDLDTILLQVVPVKDLVWLIKTYLQPGEVPSP